MLSVSESQPDGEKDPRSIGVGEARMGADGPLSLALRIGKSIGFASLDRAMQFPADRQADALKVIHVFAAQNAADAKAQVAAADLCIRKAATNDAQTIYLSALQSVAEPMVNDVRPAYCGFLKGAQKLNDLAALQQSAKAKVTAKNAREVLLGGASMLVERKYAEASEVLRPITENRKLPAETRIAAWTSLLKADPAIALQGQALSPKGEQLSPYGSFDVDTLRWMGQQLWSRVDALLPRQKMWSAAEQPYKPITTAGDTWLTRTAALMESLVNTNSQTLVGPNNLRLPLACLLALSGQQEKSDEIIHRQLDYTLQPPEGGWKLPAIGAKEADNSSTGRFKPRTFTSPGPGEAERLQKQVREFVERWNRKHGQ